VIGTDERLSTQNEWVDNDEVFPMKNSYGAVFDLDGVLLDSESDLTWLYTALEKTLEHLGIESSEENLMKIHSKNVHKFDAMSIELSVEAEDLWETRNREYIEEKIRAMKNGMIKLMSKQKSQLDFPWYMVVSSKDGLSQGDFIFNCPILEPDFNITEKKITADYSEYDVVIIGSGPAGEGAGFDTLQVHASVAGDESDDSESAAAGTVARSSCLRFQSNT